MKILSALDDPEEMLKERQQKELNSLKEMGAMTVVKRSEAVGKRVIQTRWVDREKDGRVKSSVGSEELQPMSRAHSARDVFTNTNRHCFYQQCWPQVHMIETATQNANTSQLRSTYTQHSCTQMLIQTCLQSHQNLTNGMMQRCAMMKCGN